MSAITERVTTTEGLGDQLRNGATILLAMNDIVLAVFRHEFVTWRVDCQGNCYWGHYFDDDFEEAYNDYKMRICD